MGFFKKIGGFVKKATKQISFKNLVKVGGMIDPTGLVSGIQNSHYEKKAQLQAELENNQAIANIQAQIANQTQSQSSAFAKEPNIKDILTGAAGGMLNGAGMVLAGSTTAGQAGATLVDSTLTAWFKKNWLKVIGGLLGVLLVVKLAMMAMKPKPKPRRAY